MLYCAATKLDRSPKREEIIPELVTVSVGSEQLPIW